MVEVYPPNATSMAHPPAFYPPTFYQYLFVIPPRHFFGSLPTSLFCLLGSFPDFSPVGRLAFVLAPAAAHRCDARVFDAAIEKCHIGARPFFG